MEVYTMAHLITIATILFMFLASPLRAQEENKEIDPNQFYPTNKMFRMPALIDCGTPDEVNKILTKFEEVPFAIGKTFVIRPDGIMQPGPFTLYANPQTGTISMVVKYDPPTGPGIWCFHAVGSDFKPYIPELEEKT